LSLKSTMSPIVSWWFMMAANRPLLTPPSISGRHRSRSAFMSTRKFMNAPRCRRKPFSSGDGPTLSMAVNVQHSENDNDLARRAAAGDRETFRELVDEHSAQVYRIALGLVRNHHDAEEVVQETFLRAFRGLHRFRGDAAFSSWLYRIAVNCGRDVGRKRQRLWWELSMGPSPVLAWPEPVADHPDHDPERLAASKKLRADIDRAVLGLTERERIIFVLRHDAGLKLAEIAQVIGRTEGTVKNLLFRAVRKLRSSLEAYLEVPS